MLFCDIIQHIVVSPYRRFGTIYRSHLQDNESKKDSWQLKMGQIGCPETSVRNYHCMLCNIPEQRRSHLLRGGSLKSRKLRMTANCSKVIILRFPLHLAYISTLLNLFCWCLSQIIITNITDRSPWEAESRSVGQENHTFYEIRWLTTVLKQTFIEPDPKLLKSSTHSRRVLTSGTY